MRSIFLRRVPPTKVARELIQEMAWYDDYLQRGGVDRSAIPSPGNKLGGLTNIVEKAMGSVAKAGPQRDSGSPAPVRRVTNKGLMFAATPASDFICGTLQMAAAMNMHIFTTGRGHRMVWRWPLSLRCRREPLAERWLI